MSITSERKPGQWASWAIWQRGGAAYRAIIANAGSLVGATAVTSVLGFVYWWVAARQYSTGEVGLASAAISAMTLLGTVGMLGLGTLLIGELPQRRGAEGPLIATASIVTAVTGGVLGVGFALIAPWLSPDFRPLGASVGAVMLFAVGAALTALTLVLDQALIGMMRGGLQLARNFVFSAAKLTALGVFAFWSARTFGLAIYATWTIGNALSLGALAGVALLRRVPLHRTRPDWALLRDFRRAALGHHGLNLSLQFSHLMLPLIVTVTLSAAVNAYFYAAWMIAGFVFTLPLALTVVLYAVGAADPAALARKTRFTLGIAAVSGLLTNAVLWVAAPLVLRLFGTAYATYASTPLRVLTLGVFALIIKDHYVAACRIQSRVLAASARIFAGGCLELAGAAGGAVLGGLTGLTLGWLAAVVVEAVLMAPAVVRIAAPFGLHRWRLPAEDAAAAPAAMLAVPAALTDASGSPSLPSLPAGNP